MSLIVLMLPDSIIHSLIGKMVGGLWPNLLPGVIEQEPITDILRSGYFNRIHLIIMKESTL